MFRERPVLVINWSFSFQYDSIQERERELNKRLCISTVCTLLLTNKSPTNYEKAFVISTYTHTNQNLELQYR